MATRQINWRIIDNNAYYVHSILGSDITGNGTRQNPFKTITYALSFIPKRTTFVCIGVFSEQLSNISSSTIIRGDYLGAMLFDGKHQCIISGNKSINIIFKNVPSGNKDTITITAVPSVAVGVGSIGLANYYTNQLAGCNGNYNILHNSSGIFGMVGGNTQHCIYSKMQCNDDYKIWFACGSASSGVIALNNTIYDIPLSKRCYTMDSRSLKKLERWIFAKTAMLANENLYYKECLFTADSLWYLDLDGTNVITYADMDVVIAQGNADNRGDAIRWIMQNTYGIIDTTKLPIFDNCIFTDKISTEILNDPENLDFTLKYSQDNPAILGTAYIGALPMALNIAIKQNSDGQTNCFDVRTLSGCLAIDSNNILNIDTASASNSGKILSKVIFVNPSELQFSGIYALTDNHIASQNIVLNKNNPFTQRYLDTDDLAVGKYYVVGGMIAYDDVNYSDGDTFVVTEDNTRFTIADGSPKVYFIEEQNLVNVVYVRTKSAIYEHLNSTDTLQVGGIYLNDSDNTMQYAGRTIAPHESFIAEQGYTTFIAADGQVGILFDDTRTTESEWIPSDAFGEYFVYRSNGAIQHDNYGIPISSGNSLAHVNSSNGGYSNTLIKSIMKQHFVQFGIFVHKIS